MGSANERQIGGDHYKGTDYQHWDWIHAIELPYHAAVATKYIARWRKKNGVEDLQKALHYIDKCEELNMQISVKKPTLSFKFILANDIPTRDAFAILCVTEGKWEAARDAVNLLIQTAPDQSR